MLSNGAVAFRTTASEAALASLSPDGQRLVVDTRTGPLKVFEVATDRDPILLAGHKDALLALTFSADSTTLLTTSADRTARVWDLKSGTEVCTFAGLPEPCAEIALSPNGHLALLGGKVGNRTTVSVRDVQTRKQLHTYSVDTHQGGAGLICSPDGAYALLRVGERLFQWDPRTGKEIRTLPIPSSPFAAFTVSPSGGCVVTTSMDGTVVFFDATTGKEKCRLVQFVGGNWAVVDPAGRFDASRVEDFEGLHWVVGLEPIALKQLKERYYEPHLLAKHLGLNQDPLRSVENFGGVQLYPDLVVAQPNPARPQVEINLTNRGGGIGRVVILVNGKELTADARPRGMDAQTARLTLTQDLTNDPRLEAGKPNTIEVLACNAEGYLFSRGMRLEIAGPGAVSTEKPHLWAVAVGVSEFRNPKLQLRYAAKDAEDFAAALRLAAVRLFDADHVHMRVLTTNARLPDNRPIRANLLAALQEVKARARPGDVVVLFLAGHGVLAGGEGGDFYYLTADAGSADLVDPAVRDHVSLSSKDLTDLLREIPARKQVLILDTCASGRVVEKLTDRRDVPSSQVRALHRLEDRSGVHVLAGCASDAVSYETSRYGQGVLTYSLLMGMRGGQLREGEYVDVVDLFSFAADRVPELARDIGGVQRPVIASPKGSSFDIGRVTPEDQSRIRLQPAFPLVLRVSLQEDSAFVDVLGLGRRVDERLRTASLRGQDAALVFVDAVDFPDAYRIGGRYEVKGDVVAVTVNVYKGKDKIGQLKASGPLDKLDEVADNLGSEVEKFLAAKTR